MTLTILGQSLSTIRRRYGWDLASGYVVLATHEAAHAIVARSFGYRVDELAIRSNAGDGMLDGHCRWDVPTSDDAAFVGIPHKALVTSAGLTGVLMLHADFRVRESGLFDTDTQDYRVLSLVKDWQCEGAHRFSRHILERRAEAFDRLAAALVQRTVLTASEIAAATGHLEVIASHPSTPKRTAAPPRRSSPPPRGTGRTMKDVVPGLRYSDATPMTPRGRAA